jgi:hypothetical protein
MDKESLMRKMKAKNENQMDSNQEKKPTPTETALMGQVKLLQEQLHKIELDRDDVKLREEAEKLKKEKDALMREADLRGALSDAFTPDKTGKADVEDLDQKELITIMADAVGSTSAAQGKLILKRVEEMMKETNEKILGTQKALVGLMAGMSVDQARSSFRDFDDYREDIGEILKSTNGLSPEDAYLLAKSRRAKNQATQGEVETERPSGSTTVASSYQEKKISGGDEGESELTSPKKAFKDAVRIAIDKVLAAREK